MNEESLITIIDTFEAKSEKLEKNINAGRLLNFLIRANPTKRIKDETKTKNQGKVRVPLIDESEMKSWLYRQLEGAAKLSEVMINGQDILYFRKGNHAGKMVTVTYSGILKVDNTDTLLKKVVDGIGPAKAFGCGLLSLARV